MPSSRSTISLTPVPSAVLAGLSLTPGRRAAEDELCITERIRVADTLHPAWVKASRILLTGLERLEAQERAQKARVQDAQTQKNIHDQQSG